MTIELISIYLAISQGNRFVSGHQVLLFVVVQVDQPNAVIGVGHDQVVADGVQRHTERSSAGRFFEGGFCDEDF
jgi:hypothetical protein